jgi:outer membrane receptor protein involved in Fe transport
MSDRIIMLNKAIIALTMLVLLGWLPGKALAGPSMDDGTMLLFVGEDIELLSIASRREETPARAPAVAKVIRREEFMQRGHNTLSRILRATPGFHLARREWGHQPYLRGMPDSILFLYDTVPIGSEISKSLHPIDQELSLAAIKQVEIIRGPSSVLWGPDAFAGVVNVVPLSGKDFQGGETGVLYGTPGDHKGAYLNLGHDAGDWDGFLSLSVRQGLEDDKKANLVSFFDYDGTRPVPPEKRTGSKKIGDSSYIDAYGRINLGRKLTLSGRFNDSQHPYTISSHDSDLRWKEKRSLPFGYLKLDANHDLSLDTRIRISGYYSLMRPKHEIIDKKIIQEEETYYAETLMDRSLFEAKGLLTAGLSYKSQKISDAPVWDSYIPGYLGPDNKTHLPGLVTRDFSNELWSLFTQYTHKWGDFDFMLGLRQDFHKEYQDNLSYSSAVVWSPLDEWNFKLMYGSSYRTPFARQLIDEKKPDMEKSENISFQTTWNPSRNFSLGGTMFYSRISNHILEDTYAGLSRPNRQDIYGLELEASYNPTDRLELEANLTLLRNSGSDEKYRYVAYSIVRPDGTVIDVYADLIHPFDTGPKAMFNFMASWKLSRKLTTFAHLEYFASRKLIYARGEDFEKAPGAWLVHAGASYNDFLTKDMDLTFKVRNITNNRYRTPGTYSMIRGDGVSAEVMLRYRF